MEKIFFFLIVCHVPCYLSPFWYVGMKKKKKKEMKK